ncbi:unnamed protein product [Symbiodinium sp. CCMP2592]|nr:unnamed protein product [Symbiodinium sp. CCMP2592]
MALPAGPSTSEESDRWVQRYMAKLQNAGQGPLLQKNLNTMFKLTTDYSGIGTAEEALRAILQNQTNNPLPMSVEHSCDAEQTCRFILMQHGEESRPQCLFGDIQDRIPQHAHDILERKRTEALRVLEATGHDVGKKRKSSPQKGLAEKCRQLGRDFIADAVQLLQQSLPSKKRHLRSHCYVHGRPCCVRVHPHADPSGETGSRSTTLSVAGFCCQDWSSMGNQLGWLGDTGIIWAQWCSEILGRQDDFIVCECTCNFDVRQLGMLVSAVYELHALEVCPQTLGEPVSRRRVYMLLIHRNRWQFCEHVKQSSVQEVFDEVFESNVVMPVLEKFRAPQSDVESHIQALLKRQHKPETTRTGRRWSYLQASTEATRLNVQEQRKWLEDNAIPPFTNYVANLTQSVDYIQPRQCIPALLTRSQLYLFGIERAALASEHFEVQGWNLYGKAELGPCAKLRSAFKNLPQRHQRSMSGNSMHLHVLGAVLLFLLSHVREVCDRTDSQVEI